MYQHYLPTQIIKNKLCATGIGDREARSCVTDVHERHIVDTFLSEAVSLASLVRKDNAI